MAKNETLLAAIEGLSMNEALKLQIELAKAKKYIAPEAKGQTRIVNTKKLESSPEWTLIEQGKKK